MRLEERGNNPPVLVERFVKLLQSAPVMIGKKPFIRACGKICSDALG
jgi:hypothetical protein